MISLTVVQNLKLSSKNFKLLIFSLLAFHCLIKLFIMCTIDKMLIKGIRSFSPDNEVVIEFFKARSLILQPYLSSHLTTIYPD